MFGLLASLFRCCFVVFYISVTYIFASTTLISFLLSYDEFYLNQCVIEKEGARLAGVLVNKCAPKKVDQVHQYLEKAMAPFDVPILGVVPDREFFESPCARDFEQLFNTKLMAGTDFRNRHFTEVRLASCSTRHFLSTYRKSSPATLWVIHASRTDLILALKSAAQEAEYQNRHDPNCKLEKKYKKQDLFFENVIKVSLMLF